MDILDEIMESSKDFIKFDDWREYIEKYTEELKENHTKRDLKDYVTMTTMHSSKGLEYDTVFIIDANEGITPHKKAVFDEEIQPVLEHLTSLLRHYDIPYFFAAAI